VDSVEGGAFGGAESFLAAFTPVALLSRVVDHDVSVSLASVRSAGLVVAKSLARVHAASLCVLTLDTSKGASLPASFSTRPPFTVSWGASTFG
jgi:hypothetical protein